MVKILAVYIYIVSETEKIKITTDVDITDYM